MNLSLRSELLLVLAELRYHYPNWRLGQLVSNVAGWTDAEVWDVEDEQLLAAAKAHLEHLTKRDSAAKT